jgi:peptide maturation system acyl carrier-related protein
MQEYNIQKTLVKILEKRSGINFSEHAELCDTKLLGTVIGLPARELLHIYFDIEQQFGITISEEDIVSGKFDTFKHISEIVRKNYK